MMLWFLSFMFVMSVFGSVHFESEPYHDESNNNLFGEEYGTDIMNGVLVEEGQLPFMASLLIAGERLCAGSIVTDRHILTAAHCVTGYYPHQISVGVGSVFRRFQTYYSVADIFVHPYFNPQALSFGYDIALLKLSQRLYIDGNKVSKIRLPPQGAPIPKAMGLAGWGAISDYQKDAQDALRGVRIHTIDLYTCSQRIGLQLFDNVFCDSGNNRGPCIVSL